MKHFLTFAALLATSLAFGQDGCCALMDFDGDRNVSISDFTIFLSNYGADDVPGYTDCIPCYTSVVFDVEQQGKIGLSDLLIMLSLFGAADVDFDLIWDSFDHCFDINSCNFLDVLAEECIYPDVFGICGGQCLADNDGDGICDDVDGCSDSSACNFMNPASIECVYQDALGICGGPCDEDIDGDYRCDDIDNCTDFTACNYANPGACACSYAELMDDCIDPNDIDNDNVCDDIDNCSDISACNYLEFAGCGCTYLNNDGICVGSGDLDGDGVCDGQDNCFDLSACNYGEFAVCGCTYLNNDGLCVGLGDLDGDGVCDSRDNCFDLSACNYGELAVCGCTYLNNDGLCVGLGDLDGDGRCDYSDNCFDLAACNYTGAALCGCSYLNAEGACINTNDVDNDGHCDDDDWCISLGAECHVCGEEYPYQGYSYATVHIDGKCWFAENLRSISFRNGDFIPSALESYQWLSTSQGAVAVFGEGNNTDCLFEEQGLACIEEWSLENLGRLYNGYAVEDYRKLCPGGWHVPTDIEWISLVDAQGGIELAAAELSSANGYWLGEAGTNQSGFNAVGAGYRSGVGDQAGFWGAGYSTDFWSSTGNGIGLGYLHISLSGTSYLSNGDFRSRNEGFSVRCVRDAE